MNGLITTVTAICLSLFVSLPMISLNQQSATGQESPDKVDIPLNFTLKSKGGSEEANASSMKDVTVTLKVKTSEEGSPTDIPLTAKVSNDTNIQDLDLCGSMQGMEEMCHSIGEVMQSSGENQSSGMTSNQSSGSKNATDQNNDEDEEDN